MKDEERFWQISLDDFNEFSLLELIFIVNLKSIPWPVIIWAFAARHWHPAISDGCRSQQTSSSDSNNHFEIHFHTTSYPRSEKNLWSENSSKSSHTSQATTIVRKRNLFGHILFIAFSARTAHASAMEIVTEDFSRESLHFYSIRNGFSCSPGAIITQNIVTLNDRVSSGGSDVVRGRKNHTLNLNLIISMSRWVRNFFFRDFKIFIHERNFF